MNTLRFTAFATGLLIAAGSVAAQAAQTVATTRVDIHPHELDSQAGRSQVIARIDRAAKRLCAADVRGPAAQNEARKCRSEVTEQMIAQVDSAALHADRRNASTPIKTALRN